MLDTVRYSITLEDQNAGACASIQPNRLSACPVFILSVSPAPIGEIIKSLIMRLQCYRIACALSRGFFATRKCARISQGGLLSPNGLVGAGREARFFWDK